MHVRARGNLAERVERDVESVALRICAWRDECVAAAQLAALDARQRNCDALTRLGALDRTVVHLHAPDAHGAAVGSCSSSPSPIDPDQSVPVATVPMPRSVNTRST